MKLNDYMADAAWECAEEGFPFPEEIEAWLNNESLKIVTQATLDDTRPSTSIPGIVQTVDSVLGGPPEKFSEIESITFVQVTFRGSE